jgi:hypothetical protein
VAPILNIGQPALSAVPQWRPGSAETGCETTRLGYLVGDQSAVADDPGADLRQPLAQRGHRPLLDLVGHR